MKVTLGILVQLGNCDAIEVISTTVRGKFGLPTAVFNLANLPSGVTVTDNKVSFRPVGNGPFLRFFVRYECPTETTSFLVTYDPPIAREEGNPAVWVWNTAFGPEPDETIGAFWDRREEQIVHLNRQP